jgi:hypothetical protein
MTTNRELGRMLNCSAISYSAGFLRPNGGGAIRWEQEVEFRSATRGDDTDLADATGLTLFEDFIQVSRSLTAF